MLPCVNCKKDVDPSEAKMFAETFVCPDCFVVAERFMQRGIFEANQMLVILKEAIRIGLIRGELQFTSDTIEDMKPADLFNEMSKLADKARDAQKGPAWQAKASTTILSQERTPPSVPGQDADGPPRSNST